MADLTRAVGQSHAAAPHQTGHSAKARQKRVQSVARTAALALKYDPTQPRDPKGSSTGGQFTSTGARTFTSEEGYQWHEQGDVASWAKGLSYADSEALKGYGGFGYHSINDLRRGTFVPRTVANFVRAATEEEYEASKVQVDAEYLSKHPHPFAREPYQRLPDEPYGRAVDAEGNFIGHYESNQFYVNPATGEKVRFSVQRPGPDVARLAEVQRQADHLDDLIANRGHVLTEDIVVQRGAYLPDVTVDQLQDMVNDESVWEEKGFTSTFVGDAGRRAESYPALGKWESIHNRFPGDKLATHANEVGTAVRFYITLPAGTKVASVEAARRVNYKFPKIPDPSPRPEGVSPEYWMKTDYTGTPTLDTKDLDDTSNRTESELLLGSGARFRVKKVFYAYTYPAGGDVPPVKVYSVHLEYIGGGSSDGRA